MNQEAEERVSGSQKRGRGFRYPRADAADDAAGARTSQTQERASEAQFASDVPAADSERPVSQAMHGFGELFAELRGYGHHYLTAQADRFKISIRNAVMYGMLGLVMVVITLSVAVTAAALAVIGAAHGLGAAFGPGWSWLGDLSMGVLLVACVAGAIRIAVSRVQHRARLILEHKYEYIRLQERREHGRDATERAAKQR